MVHSRWRSQASGILLRAIGLLLITAAGMKLWGIPTDPVAKVQFFREAWFGAALVQFELLLVCNSPLHSVYLWSPRWSL